MRRAANKDKNQAVVIDALKKVGVAVEIIKQPLDLLIHARATCPHCKGVLPDGKTALMEIKNPERTSEQPLSRLTEAQIKFIGRWPGPIHIVETAEEAIEAVLGKGAISGY